MGPASLSVLTSAAVDALVPLHFQLPPMRYFLPSKAACGAPGGPPAPKKACIFDCGARWHARAAIPAVHRAGGAARDPRGLRIRWRGWDRRAVRRRFLGARAPGKRVWRAWSTLVRTTREAMVLNGDEEGGSSGWWKDARLGSLAVARDVAEAARPAPQRATSAHLDEKLLFGRSCPGGPGYARPPRRRAASGGRPREAASRAPAAFAARDDRALPRTKPRRSSVFYFSIFSGAAPSRGSLTCRRGWSSPRAGAGRRTSSSPSRRRPPPGRAASGR